MTYTQLRALAGFSLLAVVLVFAGCDSSEPLTPQEEEPEQEAQTAEFESEPIEGQYIVVLNEDAVQGKSKAAVRNVATELLGKSGSLGATYSTALSGFSASSVSEAKASQIENDPRVDFVEQDQVVTYSPPPWAGGGDDGGSSGQTTPYGITRVGGATSGVSGTAWVLDTGVDLDHPDLNVDTDRSAVFVSQGPGSKSANDKDGHGTHVAGTIAAIDNSRDVVGVAEGATVVAVKVLDDKGSGSYSDIIDGVDYVAQNGSPGDVANMSLGGGTSDALDTAVENAASNGIYFSIAAGNSSDDANNYSPARVEATNVYTVSAFDDTDTFATSFSNYSGPTDPPIEYGGPGVDVLSLYADGGTNTLSGTSMSAPHVAGVLLATGGSPSTDGNVSNDPDGDPDPIAVQ